VTDAVNDTGCSPIDKVLVSIESASLAELMSIWRAHAPEKGAVSSPLFRCLGERILAQGEPLLAYDVITAGLTTWPKDVRLRQLQGLALARSGATERANAILEALQSEGQASEETLGMLGRTYKDLAATASTETQRLRYLQRAAEIYAEAYQGSRGYWSGINAATMSLLIGNEGKAEELAKRVEKQCLKEIVDPRGDSYWELAALGEAALIRRDWSKAEEWYGRAAGQGEKRYGDLNSSRRNARLILRYWNQDEHWIDRFLHVPKVLVFAGHMIDRPDRTALRFPRDLENAVADDIRRKLRELKPGFGFSSAACGSDLLFLEAMLECDGEISVVLPYNEEEFIIDSVEIGSKAREWHQRFDQVLARAARVITASNQRIEIGGISYEFCNQLLLGLAAIRARQLDTELVPVAVWNGAPGDNVGGTASVVAAWRSLGYEPHIIALPQMLEGRAPPATPEPGEGGSRPTNRRNVDGSSSSPQPVSDVLGSDAKNFRSRIVSILFADAVGFSRLAEAEVPRFVQHFLGAIAQLGRQFADGILAKNTWGDGLYYIFGEVDRAGEFALALADLVCQTNWQTSGLPPDLNLRIALHAGPAYEFEDPITGTRTFSGSHVSRAARIEPITPKGQVYASEAFAALAAAQPAAEFTCEYVGQTPMAKGYGTFPVYHVRRARLSG
jgi:class 3 adenylate cyclase